MVALIIVAIVMVFSLGSLFLSDTNLGIAEKQRTQAIARNNAEAGLETAFVSLKNSLKAEGQLPSTLTLPASPDSEVSYSLASGGYTPYTSAGLRTQAQVKVLGTGPRGARYISEALIDASNSLPTVKKIFYSGLVSKATVSVSGGGTYTDAEIHGDMGYSLSSTNNFLQCTSRDSSGNCTATSNVNADLSKLPLTAAPGMSSYTCSVSGSISIACSGGSPTKLTAAADLTTPDFAGMKTFLLTANPCTITVATLPATIAAGSVICVSGNVNLTSQNFNNAIIIADGDVTSSGGTNLSQVSIVSKTGKISFSGGNTLATVKMYADTTVTLSGGTTAVTGKSTVASGGGITMSGGTSALTITDGKPTIGLALISPGNITLSGGSDMYASVWGGATTTLTGGTTLRGGIASVGSVVLSGGAAVDAYVNVENDELEHSNSSGPIVLSRR